MTNPFSPPKTETIRTRVRKDEKAMVQHAAEQEGMTASSFARRAMVRAAREVTQALGADRQNGATFSPEQHTA